MWIWNLRDGKKEIIQEVVSIKGVKCRDALATIQE
jgi:hypothetical protein